MNVQFEWTLDEKFARCRDAGFSHTECFIQDDNYDHEVLEKLAEHGLQWSLEHRPINVEDTLAATNLWLITARVGSVSARFGVSCAR